MFQAQLSAAKLCRGTNRIIASKLMLYQVGQRRRGYIRNGFKLRRMLCWHSAHFRKSSYPSGCAPHALLKLDHVNRVGWRPLKATSCILCECDVVPSCILCECDVVTCMLGLWRLRTCTSVDQNAPARPPPRFELWLSLVVVRLERESCGVELHIRALAWARKRWERLPGLRWCALPIVVEFV